MGGEQTVNFSAEKGQKVNDSAVMVCWKVLCELLTAIRSFDAMAGRILTFALLAVFQIALPLRLSAGVHTFSKNLTAI
jgi:hypothetical protein